MEYALNCVSPWDEKKPHVGQQKIIEWALRPSPKIKIGHLVCGRGYGKSICAVLVAFMALARGPGEIVLFLEPDWNRINTVFLKKWRKIVPKELYTINKDERRIEMIWGAQLYYRPRNVTGSVSSSDDANLGQDVTGVIDDEAALRCSRMFFVNTFATLREPSPARFYLTLTTPRLGPYNELIMSPGHTVFRGSSYDNPYNPDGYADEIAGNMSSEQIRRDVYGESVSLEGMLWPMCDLSPEKRWPNNNIDSEKFVRGKPYLLAGDIGVRSSWYVIQSFPGRECIVGQYHPDKGNASEDVEFLLRKYGQPVKIIIGIDAETHSQVTGESAVIVMRRALNKCGMHSQVPVDWPKGEYVDKMIQRDALTRLLEKRFLTVAESAIDLDKNKAKFLDGNRERDFKHMILGDEWPGRDCATWFKKDKRTGAGYEDSRDAALHYAICQHPINVRSL